MLCCAVIRRHGDVTPPEYGPFAAEPRRTGAATGFAKQTTRPLTSATYDLPPTVTACSPLSPDGATVDRKQTFLCSRADCRCSSSFAVYDTCPRTGYYQTGGRRTQQQPQQQIQQQQQQLQQQQQFSSLLYDIGVSDDKVNNS